MPALLRLLTWMSPSFPIGAFAYSGGLERAVADGLVRDRQSLSLWIETGLKKGALGNDAVLLAAAHRRHDDQAALAELAELAAALAGSGERYVETLALGDAFADAARAWPDPVLQRLPRPVAYPVAVGSVAAANGILAEPLLGAFLHASAAQLVSAGIRLGIAGQSDGLSILAALEASIAEVARRAVLSGLDDLGSATVMAEITSLKHEVQRSRLFRS